MIFINYGKTKWVQFCQCEPNSQVNNFCTYECGILQMPCRVCVIYPPLSGADYPQHCLVKIFCGFASIFRRGLSDTKMFQAKLSQSNKAGFDLLNFF